ncbi:hypothetical protein [Streptosporangium canum]|uniref:hypothetical protein n=1 Tax=Streptosporangium canum TaxID=324952 RepID=UPI0033AB3264
MCWFFSGLVLGISTLVLDPLWTQLGLQKDPALQAIPTLAIWGAIVGFWLFFRGFGYIARPWIKHYGRYEQVGLPNVLGRRSKNRLAVDAFWLTHVRTATIFVTMCQFWTAVPIWLGDQLPSVFKWGEGGYSSILLLMITFLPPIVLANWVVNCLKVRWAVMELSVRLARLVSPVEPEGDQFEEGMIDLILEPNFSLRRNLADITGLLDDASNRLDAQQEPGFTPHPIATVLRGVSSMLRDFLMRPNYGARLPSDLDEVLRLVLVILTGPKTVAPYEDLTSLVSAFDDKGMPLAKPSVKSPGRISRMFSRATTSVQGALTFVGALAALTVPLLAIALAVIGKIDVEKLVELLK